MIDLVVEYSGVPEGLLSTTITNFYTPGGDEQKNDKRKVIRTDIFILVGICIALAVGIFIFTIVLLIRRRRKASLTTPTPSALNLLEADQNSEDDGDAFDPGRTKSCSTLSVSSPKSKYVWFQQFSGYVDHTGGEITSITSDVAIFFPPGAIPKKKGKREVVVKVYLDAEYFNLLSDSEQTEHVQLSPIVECTVSGCQRFEKEAVVRIPHRAQIPKADWTLKGKWSESKTGEFSVWNDIIKKSKSSDITFTYDEAFVYMNTKHFTKFACIGCGNKKILNLNAVVFGNFKTLDGIQQVNFRIYLCDGSKDTHQKLLDNEKEFNGRCRSQYKPLTSNSSKDWEVAIALDEDWPWKLRTKDEVVKLVTMQRCFKCCHRPPSVDFRCLPKEKSKVLTEIEAEFTVSQLRKRRGKMERVHLITHDFRFEQHKILELPFSTELLNENHLEVIVTNIEYQAFINLCRRLSLSDVDIDAIKKDYPGASKEQKYQLLKFWISKSGNEATLTHLIASCREESLNKLADTLENIFMNQTSNC